MDITEEISFFDPRAIAKSKLDANIVVKVELVTATSEYIVSFKDGTSKTLPSTIPNDSIMVQTATVVGDDLIINLDDGQSFNIGRIATVLTFDDITPVGTGLLMPGSRTQFKEIIPNGGGLSLTTTAEEVSLDMVSGGGGGFKVTAPGELDFTEIFIGDRFTAAVYDMGAGRTYYVDDLTGLAENTWHDYIFNRAQLDTLNKHTAGTFNLTAGQYYLDFNINLQTPTSFNIRLQDVTNNVTLMTGKVVNNVGTFANFTSTTSDMVGDFILPTDANVKVQFNWVGGDIKRIITPTRINANTGGNVGGQIFLSKIAAIEDVVNSSALLPIPTSTAIDSLRTRLTANAPYTLELLPAVTGAGLETHATVPRYISKVTAPSGLTYLPPAAATNLVVYDPATNAANQIKHGSTFLGPTSFCGGAVDSAGLVYLAPSDHNEFLRVRPQPVGGWDRVAIDGFYDLLAPGLIQADPQLVILGTIPTTGWGTIGTTLVKNRSAGDIFRYKSPVVSAAVFTFELSTPQVVKGMAITNLSTFQVTGFKVSGLVEGQTVYEVIAEVSVETATSRLLALAPASTTLYKTIKLEIMKGVNYITPSSGTFDPGNPPPNSILPMTADVSNGQTATSSGNFNSTTTAFNAFTNAISWGGWVSTNGGAISVSTPAWVAVDLGVPKAFNAFSISNRGYNTTAHVGGPRDFTLQGWNATSSTWVTIHTVVARTDNVASSTTYYSAIGDHTYQKVRIHITARNSTADGIYVCVGRIQLFNATGGGGQIAIEKLEIVADGAKDLTLPYGYIEKIGSTTTALNKWRDAVYDPIANKVLFIPMNAGSFMVYDVVTGTMVSTTFGLTIPASNAILKAVYNPVNKLIYCASALMGTVPIIDLSNMRSKVITITRPTTPVNTTIWSGAFIGVDGKVYFCPCNGTEWLVICPNSGAYWLEYFSEVADVTKQGKGVFGAYGADGRYYVSDVASNINNLGLDTLNLTKKRVTDAQLTKLTMVNFTDKFGNVYLLNGVSENRLIKLNFGLGTLMHQNLLTGQFT